MHSCFKPAPDGKLDQPIILSDVLGQQHNAAIGIMGPQCWHSEGPYTKGPKKCQDFLKKEVTPGSTFAILQRTTLANRICEITPSVDDFVTRMV